MENSAQVFNSAAKAYRDFPLLDAKFIDADTRRDIKEIFGLIYSQKHLKASINDQLDPVNEYSETSPFLATLRTRLATIEQRLKFFEGKYGRISEYNYQ